MGDAPTPPEGSPPLRPPDPSNQPSTGAGTGSDWSDALPEPAPDGPPPLTEPPPLSGPPPLTEPPPLSGPPPLSDPAAVPDPETAPVHSSETHSQGSEQPAGSRAIKHVTEQSRTYPCEACGGELHFDIASQKLKCEHCGNVHDLIENDEPVHENDLRAALRLIREGRVTHTANFLDDEKEIVCQNCGGHTTFTGSLTANNCPYCATPIQRDDVHAAPERLPVDAVLPFSIDDKHAATLIEDWINGRWFAPSEFKRYNRTGSFQSVYMAYFTYDANTVTSYTGQRGIIRTRTVGSGDNQRTETYTQWFPAAGTVGNEFDDVPVLANTGFEKNRIDKLEPWPTQTAKPYSAEYAAGHLARTYDNDVEECLGEATSVMEEEIKGTIRRHIGGDVQRIGNMNIRWREMTYKHVLLPLWLLTVIYDGRPYQVYINGATGEVHGARPYSKAKIAFAVIAVLVVMIIALIAFTVSGGSS
jgi:Zn finger protein HypA/HybF involved in hydrogenase expression